VNDEKADKIRKRKEKRKGRRENRKRIYDGRKKMIAQKLAALTWGRGKWEQERE
jgi:hypothetical protein